MLESLSAQSWLVVSFKGLLSPLLRVILLQGSKLTLGLSRRHYPDSCIYCHAFPGTPSDPGNAIHTTRQRRGFPSPSTALFSRPTPSSHPHQFLATSTFKLRFSDDCTPFKIQFYHKITWYKSCGQDHSVHTLFLIVSFSPVVKDNTLS